LDALVLPIPSRDRAPRADEHARFRAVFFRVAPAMFIGTLDQAIVAAALPAIAADLGGLGQIAWLVTAYLLAATVAAPVYGRLGDAFGRKPALLTALALFLAGSVACAIAASLPFLIAGRALQGLGGGGLMTLAQALIGEAVTPRERGRFQGWFGAIFALASTLGPVAGGVLSETLGWRSIFWVNVPLAIAAAAAAARLAGAPGQGRFFPDAIGTPLFAASTVALLLSLSLGGHASWTSPTVAVPLVLAVVGFLLLWPVEVRARDPLIPPALVRLPTVWRSSVCVFLFASLLFAMIVQLPMLLELGYGLSPASSGLMLLPLTLTQVVVSTITGSRISATARPTWPMFAGLATAGVALAVLAGVVTMGPIAVCLASTVMGIGLGTIMPAAQTIVQWASGSEHLGTATGLLSFARSIGGVVGAAMATAILFAMLSRSSPAVAEHIDQLASDSASSHPGALPGVLPAFRWVFGALALVGAMAAAVARSLPDVDLSSAPSAAPAPQAA
jgi:EmrB/QacA subfamily drug resistance transporter